MAGYPPPSTPRKPRRWIWILVGLVLATALGGGAFAVDQHLTQRSDRLTFYKKVADLQKPAFVLITRDEIYLNGKPVATTRALANNDSPNWKVAALYKRLQTRRYRHNMTTDEAFHREVTLCAAKQTDFKVLKKVLHTCEFAGFSDQTVGLPEGSIPEEVSRMETSACSVMELQRQRPLTSGAPEKRIRINVLVGDDGFTITAGGERMVVARKGASLDHATLALRLKEIHDRLPAKDDLTAVAEDDVTTADILAIQPCMISSKIYSALRDSRRMRTIVTSTISGSSSTARCDRKMPEISSSAFIEMRFWRATTSSRASSMAILKRAISRSIATSGTAWGVTRKSARSNT